jgi:hypothetical protein
MTESATRQAAVDAGARARDVRAGATALILAGLVLVPVPFLQNIPTDPEENVAFALGANSTSWRVSMLLAMVSVPLLVYGFFTLYSHLARTHSRGLARVGLVTSVGLLLLFVPMYGFAAFVVPAIGEVIASGQPDAVDVMEQTFKEPFIAVPFLCGIFLNFGYVLTGIAVWRSRTLWKWGGVILAVAGIVGVPAFLDIPAAQNVAPIVFAAGTTIIGVGLWKRARLEV